MKFGFASLSRVTGFWILVMLISGFSLRGQGTSADSLAWTGSLTNVLVGVAAGVSLQALDAEGQFETNFNGTVYLSALARGETPRLLLSEILVSPRQAVELCNVSDAALSLNAWQLTFYDSITWPEPHVTFTFPPGSVCPPRSVFRVIANGTAPGLYPIFQLGAPLAWSNNSPGNPQAVLLREATGRVIDFFCAGGAYP